MSRLSTLRRQGRVTRAARQRKRQQQGRIQNRRLLLEQLEPRTVLATITPLPAVEPFVGAMDDSGDWVVLLSRDNSGGGNADNNPEVFLFQRTTNALTQITDTLGNVNGRPDISGDGARVVFSSTANPLGTNADGNAEIFLWESAGPTLRQLTATSSGSNLFPSISRDGTHIAFESNANLPNANNPDGNFEIFLIRLSPVGVTLTQLTTTASGQNVNAVANRDGTRIAFNSSADLPGADNADGNAEVFLLDTATSQFRQLTATAAGRTNGRPSINAAGNRVVFASNADLTGDNPDQNREAVLAQVSAGGVTLTSVTATSSQDTAAFGHPSINALGDRISLYSLTAASEIRISIFSTVSQFEREIERVATVPVGFLQLVNRDNALRDALFAPINGRGDTVAYTTADNTVTVSGAVAVETLHTFRVNSNGDATDSSPGDGICHTGATNSVGDPECTLRAAIQEANALGNLDANTPDEIVFDIPGPGPHTIQPNSALPAIVDPVVIDGHTQPGAAPNSNPFPQALNGSLLIELDGSRAGEFVNGLTLNAGNSTVRGLVIGNFRSDGISISMAGRNVIEGNYLGTNVSGTAARSNDQAGVGIFQSAGNRIGGTRPAQRNLISGNRPAGAPGVSIFGNTAGPITQILGNFIGTDAAGQMELGNFSGVFIFSGMEFVIGGPEPTAGNLISANQGPGIAVLAADVGNRRIQNNRIGTDATGVAPLGNKQNGISLEASGVAVVDNIIAFSQPDAAAPGAGIVVGLSANQNSIRRNSFFSNAGLGIDLAPTGFTANDPDDADTGANNRQNFPEIDAIAVNGQVSVTYSVPSLAPHSAFPLDIEFYLADAAGQEGQTLIGTDVYQANSGSKVIAFTPLAPVSAGSVIVATATDANGNTSEFSPGSFVQQTCSTVVTHTGDSGAGSLREAINCVNSKESFQTIQFAIPADDPGHMFYMNDNQPQQVSLQQRARTDALTDDGLVNPDPDCPHSWYLIRPTEPLPPIEREVVIDGGGSPNTIPAYGGLNTIIRIQLDGSLALAGNGLEFRFGSLGSRVQGLSVTNWAENGIVLSNGVEVAGNFLGVDPCGLISMGNGRNGVSGRFVGLTLIGGSDPADRNLISGNGANGIDLVTHSISNTIEANLIGTDKTGQRSLGNAQHGILVHDASGPENLAYRNLVAFNGAAGIAVGRPADLLAPPPSQLAIVANHIHGNGGLGIDLNSDGVTPNDPDDPATPEPDPDSDMGPNGFQNAPEITSAVAGVTTTVRGTLRSVPNSDYRLEFFASPERDPAGFGEGATFLGFVNVRTSPAGEAVFAVPLLTPVSIGSFVTATASLLADQDFDPLTPPTPAETSEFSAAFEVQPPAIQLLEFGDAPTAEQSGLAGSYPTRLPEGARHHVSVLFLGSAVDAEADGQPTVGADGDGEDEDGVVFVTSLVATAASPTKASVLVTASAPGKLDAWIDFNRDGDWLDAGEQLFAASLDVAAGVNLVTFTVPAGASAGQTYARFRLSSAGGLQPTGPADDGEVEDYRLTILDGAAGAHAVLDLIVGAVQVVAEGNEIVVRRVGQGGSELFRAPGNALASGRFLGTPGDDAVALGNLTSALAAPIPLIFDGGAGRDTLRLSGSNQTLDLTDSVLNQLANLEVLDIVGNSPNRLIVTEAGVRAAAAASGTLLVRHDDDDTVEYRGRWDVLTPAFADGVFVHVVRQGAATLHIANTLPWQNPVNKLDGNRDGSVSPIDVLIDVNTLNDVGSRLLPAPTPGNVPEFYHDSSGDRFVSPLDPLQKINFLNNPSGGEGEAQTTSRAGSDLFSARAAAWAVLAQWSDQDLMAATRTPDLRSDSRQTFTAQRGTELASVAPPPAPVRQERGAALTKPMVRGKEEDWPLASPLRKLRIRDPGLESS